MSTKCKIRDQSKRYFVSFAVVNWIDVFSRKDYRDIFLESVKFCQSNKGLEVYGWAPIAIGVSNHVHMIIGTQSMPLEGIIRDLKKFTSFKIIDAIKNNTQESRREWMIWIACPDQYRDLSVRAKGTQTIPGTNSGSRTTIQSNWQLMK